MKTAELRTQTVYMHRQGEYRDASPAIVLEAALWVERDVWRMVDGKNQKIRTLRRAEKGERPGRGSGFDYKKTGVPILRLNVSHYSFRDGADLDYKVVDSPDDLLAKALQAHDALELVDTDTNVFADGKRFRRVSVDVRYADGKTRAASVEFEIVRPQDIHQTWESFIQAERARLLQEAEWAKQKAERQQTAVQQANEISKRVTDLLGDEPRFDHNGERYDVRRKSGSNKTYEVSHELLVKLLAMAEGGSTE